MARRSPTRSDQDAPPSESTRPASGRRPQRKLLGPLLLAALQACGQPTTPHPIGGLCAVIAPVQAQGAEGLSFSDLLDLDIAQDDRALIAQVARRYAQHPGGVGEYDQVLTYLARRSATPTLDADVDPGPSSQVRTEARALDDFLRDGAC